MTDKKKKKWPFGIKDKKIKKAVEKAENEKKAMIEKTHAVHEYLQSQGVPNDNLPMGRGISPTYDFQSAEVGVNFYFENVDDKNIIIIEPVGREFVDATGSEVVDARYVENYFNNTTVEKVEEACEIRYHHWRKFVNGIVKSLTQIKGMFFMVIFLLAVVLYYGYTTHTAVVDMQETLQSIQSSLSTISSAVAPTTPITLNPTDTVSTSQTIIPTSSSLITTSVSLP